MREIGATSDGARNLGHRRTAGWPTAPPAAARALPLRPWMDTNVALPLSGGGVDRCVVAFDYWLDADAIRLAAREAGMAAADAAASDAAGQPARAVVDAALRSPTVRDGLRDSNRVQEEDVGLCEAVQVGLRSPAYGVGRYAPGPEAPMYHFHSQLYERLLAAL